MDSLTQIVLGASVAAICVPKNQRRKAIIIGSILGTLPDLDVFIDHGDPVANFTFHRGFSHSLFTLLPLSIFIWALLRKFYHPVKSAPLPWLFAISLALLTHPLLDAHTAYGTQLFWPLNTPPIMWSTLFIIDPLYTLPLLFGVIVTLIRPNKSWVTKTLAAGLIISTMYVTWAWTAKYIVEKYSIQTLQTTNTTQIFSTPTPFNTFLWRIVVLQDDNYLEGYYSVFDSHPKIDFQSYPKNTALLEQAGDIWAVQQLNWFSHGFIKATLIQNTLAISDLRMGFEGAYVFTHIVAKKDSNNIWQPITNTRLASQLNLQSLSFIWNKLITN